MRITLPFFLIYFTVCSLHLSSQTRLLDSLNLTVQNAKHDSTKANSYLLIGREYLGSNPDTFIFFCKKALTIYETLPAEISSFSSILAKKGVACNNIGFLYQQKGESKTAIEYFLRAKDIFTRTKNTRGIGYCYFNLAGNFEKEGDFKKAMNYAQISKDLYEEISFTEGVSNALELIGNMYDNMGDKENAITHYRQSILLKEKANNLFGLGSSYYNLGLCYFNNGDYSKAMDCVERSKEYCEKIRNNNGFTRAVRLAGVIHEKSGNYQKSLECYFKCLKSYEGLNLQQDVARTMNMIGITYDHMGLEDDALEFYSKSIEINKKIENMGGVSSTLNNIGIIYRNKLNYKMAIQYFEESLIIFNRHSDKSGLSLTYGNLGFVYLSENKLPEAKRYALLSLNEATSLGRPDELHKASLFLYKVYLKEKNYDSAFICLNKVSEINRAYLNNYYYTLSLEEKELFLLKLENDHMRMFELLDHYRNKKEAAILAYNSALSAKGLSLRSSTSVRNAILKSKDTTLVHDYGEWMMLKRKIERLQFSHADTKELEERANEIERMLVKKASSFDDFEKVKNLNWVNVKKSLKKNEAAIEFVCYKSESDDLHPVKYAALLVKPGSHYPEMISLCSESDLESILGTTKVNDYNLVDKVYGTLVTESTALYEKLWKPLEGSLSGVKNIYYSPAGLLHKITFAAIPCGKNSYLCDRYHLNLTGSTVKVALPERINYSSQDGIMLVGGVNYKANITAPDSVNYEVWNYLPGTLSEVTEIRQLLVKAHPTLQYYTNTNANEEHVKNGIAMANVLHVATHGFFFPDPEIEKEKVRKVNSSALTNSSTTNPTDLSLVGSTKVDNSENKKVPLNFRGTRMESSTYAGWSFVNNKNPLMRTGLVLAGANGIWTKDPVKEGEDGVLTAAEIANMDLRQTKLAVLSACETGLGDIKGSEGVYGLQRAFKMAGAKYIIMSLWQVPDKETSEFMTTFYAKLTACKDIEKAFHQTQKEMRKKYDPYFWAAFTLLE